MPYQYLLNTITADKWKKVSTQRRSGIAIPLFSLYSRSSIGTGEIPDLKYLIDWCVKTGMSIIQLLPLNEVGGDFAPYSAISTFAQEPMYLSLRKLIGINENNLKLELNKLRTKYPNYSKRVNYNIKSDKLELLWEAYKKYVIQIPVTLQSFIENNKYWINDYALYKVLSEQDVRSSLPHSPGSMKELDDKTRKYIETNYNDRIKFYCWLQWQLHEQLKEIKQYANSNGVLLIGDLPFLVSKISADVWSHPEYFNLDEAAGAPPDMYFAEGQKWGNPPFNWKTIEKDGYKYIAERLKYAENFYDMYRIDHFIGLFRLWTIPQTDDKYSSALQGKFVPADEEQWEEHGKKIIKVFLKAASMLPCAEDLGTVPSCSYTTLREFGIPGIEFQRFLKEPGSRYGFKLPHNYRTNSAAVMSTHDSTFFISWWKYEAGTLDKTFFRMLCREHNIRGKLYKKIVRQLFNLRISRFGRFYWKDKIDSEKKLLKILQLKESEASDIIKVYHSSYGEKQKFLDYLGMDKTGTRTNVFEFLKRNLEKINESASIFSIQQIQDYLCLDKKMLKYINKRTYRINTPGTFSMKNWSIRLPLYIEDLLKLDINETILEINRKTDRVVKT